jgi:Fic family protein
MDTNLLSRFQKEKAKRLKDGLYHNTQIKLAYNTNGIEGSSLTEKQTRYIFEINTLDVDPNVSVNVDDIIETVNHFSCFDYMLDGAGENLSDEIIKEFHRILKNGTSYFRQDFSKTGDYKSHPNIIDGHETTPPAQVSGAMNDLLASYLNTSPIDLEAIVNFHYYFEKIHPFQDGNGRVGRIILFRECLKHGIVPFFIESENKMPYYQGLKEFETTPAGLVDICRQAQDKYKEFLGQF